MSDFKPSNNRGGKRPSYHNMPKNKKNAKTGTRYGYPKKPKLPTSVIITNILMGVVILSICGVIFAITYNNIKYDKADKSRMAQPLVSLPQSSVSQPVSSAPQPVSSAPEPVSQPASSQTGVSGDTVSSAANSESEVSSSDNSASTEPITAPSKDYDAEFFTNDLFIGDSIFTGLYGYSYIDKSNVAASIGYTTYGAQTTAFDETRYSGSAVDYAKEKQPKHIIIMLGSNSLSPQTDFDDFKTGYSGLISNLSEKCPDSKICVVSVPPITADSSLASYSGVTNEIIDKANGIIKTVCSEKNVLYYDLNSVLKDSTGCFSKDYAEADGLHFLGSTYPVLLSGVQKILEEQ